ncbi:MAG TPA: hypothetical protein VFB58_00560 [Chloroflexota bacterium]|nr:hypothetical protein [Chloroflexota bacterium]
MASSAFDAATVLSPVRLRLGLARLSRGMVRGVGAGGAAGVILLGAARLGLPTPLALPVSLPVLGAAIGAALAVRAWPRWADAAHAVDRHFGLHDRVTTALQLSTAQTALPALQREDTFQRIAGLRLTDSNRLGIPAREAGAAAGVLLLLLILLFLPQPVSRASTVAGTGSNRLRHTVVTQVPAITRRAQQGLTLQQRRNPALHALALALMHLQRRLLRSPNRRSALRAISATQQQLHRLAATQHPISPFAARAAGQALQHLLTPAERRQLLSAHSSDAALARALQRLASSLPHMTPSQRAALASALARAANNTADNTLRSALHAAASALGYNDQPLAQSALRSAAQALSQSPAASMARRRALAAASSLDSLKNAISGLTSQSGPVTALGQGPGTGGQRSGGNGRGGQGAGKGSGSGQGSGHGRGAGQGNGAGHGAGSGHGSGSGSGRGGTGGHGIGGGRGGSGPQGQGRYAASHVYIPQRPHSGPHTILTGPNGAPLPGASVPYTVVVNQYAHTARTALDHSSLPPSLRAEVRSYFSAISH